MSDATLTSYDEVPYDSHAFAQTHPDRLATVAALLGMKPPPVERCRVLELGCASGGNLIPMAQALPDSRFVGLDLSSRQIAAGQKMIDALGLKNIVLRHQSILDVTRDLGLFSYIICHGVYSWVPAPVQDRILEICVKNLAANGVAYVSYNTYPGWHMRGMIRDMMCYHARQFAEPRVRVQQARNLLDFLARSVAQANNPYGLFLQSELEVVRHSRDAYLFHEHLEEVNEPIYFYQFAERAVAKKLQFLGEADLRVMAPGNFPPEVQTVLQMLAADIIHLEQYMDFLRNRMFRQTLLCHSHHMLNYGLRPERLSPFWAASPARPISPQPDLRSLEFEKFQGPDGTTFSLRQPLAKAAMLHLSEMWPRSVSFDALRAEARARLQLGPDDTPQTAAQDAQILWQCLVATYTSAATPLAELHLCPPLFVTHVSERPVASPLARLQATASHRVTNLRHEPVLLDLVGRQMVAHLDGSRDRSALVGLLTEAAAQGRLDLEQDGKPVEDAATLQEVLQQAVDQQLPQLAANALLVS